MRKSPTRFGTKRIDAISFQQHWKLGTNSVANWNAIAGSVGRTFWRKKNSVKPGNNAIHERFFFVMP